MVHFFTLLCKRFPPLLFFFFFSIPVAGKKGTMEKSALLVSFLPILLTFISTFLLLLTHSNSSVVILLATFKRLTQRFLRHYLIHSQWDRVSLWRTQECSPLVSGPIEEALHTLTLHVHPHPSVLHGLDRPLLLSLLSSVLPFLVLHLGLLQYPQ